ncbi:MAG TPA: response regulator [Armatimonadota bacterium]|nr:response regulator [Armatimonadota bacterium]
MGAYRVLVVDDEPMIRLSMCDMLEICGYTVAGEAGDGEQALEMTRSLKPDVILMDISMPRKDGLQAAAEIMGENPTPIVFLSAFTDQENIARAGNAGAYAYLVKPCRHADLAPAIETALSRFKETRQQIQQAASMQNTLQAVRRLSKEIAASTDLDGIVATALDCVLGAMQVPAASLMLLREGRLQIRAQQGLDPTYAASFQVLPVEKSIYGEACLSLAPATFAAAEDESRKGPWSQMEHPFGRCGSALAVPVHSPNAPAAEVFGCLCVYRPEEDSFSAPDAATLAALADELVVAFESAQLRHALAWRRWRGGSLTG